MCCQLAEDTLHWETLSCPNRSCRYYGQVLRQGRLVKNGSSHGKQQALWRSWGRSVSLTYGTAYFDLEAAPAIFALTVRALAAGNAIHRTARLVPMANDTVCAWLNRAAHPGRVGMWYPWQNLPVTAGQRDAVWRVVHTQEHPLAAAPLGCATYGDAWVGVAVAPACRRVGACVGGKRPQEHAHLLLERVVSVPADAVPCFSSDHWPA
jgi:hypothetical protein